MNPWIYPVKKIITANTIGWCKIPYPGHPKGCPKYGNSINCPPDASDIEGKFHLDKPTFLVHSEFNLEGHAKNMKQKHSDWSERQCKNVLYWQSRSRKQLKLRVREFLMSQNAGYGYTMCPEGMGLNVYATALKSGLKLERIRHLKTCRHVALVGYLRLEFDSVFN